MEWENVSEEQIKETLQNAVKQVEGHSGAFHVQCPFPDCQSYRVKPEFEPHLGKWWHCNDCEKDFS